MDWILIGILAGSIVTSGHPTREACEGRAVILREQKASARCVEVVNGYALPLTGVYIQGGNGK